MWTVVCKSLTAWLLISILFSAPGLAQVLKPNPVLKVSVSALAPTTGLKVSPTEFGDNNAAEDCSSLPDKAQPPHSVTLSWNASLPASKSPHGVILGYIVYRSAKSHDRNALPVNYTRITGTTFSDCSVEAGKTYYYTARAVDTIGRTSLPSNEVRVQIPH